MLTSSTHVNEWLRTDEMYVYVRRSMRSLNRQVYTTFEVANVEVQDPHKSKGYFTDWLTEVGVLASNYVEAIYFECVLNPRLVTFLSNRGYRMITEDKICINMFKLLKE